jgi:hypothetical protein
MVSPSRLLTASVLFVIFGEDLPLSGVEHAHLAQATRAESRPGAPCVPEKTLLHASSPR